MTAVDMQLLLVRAAWFLHVKPDSGLEMLPRHLLNRWVLAGYTGLLPPRSVSTSHLKRSKRHGDGCALFLFR